MQYDKIQCLGYAVFNDSLERIKLDDSIAINTINQYSYCMAEEDPSFKLALMDSDVLLPDGVGIVAATRFLKGQKIKKIAGSDLHDFMLQKLDREHGSCFYLGSAQETLDGIKRRIAKEYPNIRVGFHSPPFKIDFSKEDNAKMIAAVNDFGPDVTFVGMTAPKQEKWAFEHKKALNTKAVCAIGAVFDFYAGTIKRPGAIFQQSGMEWLGRLIKEPKRMWVRYIYYGAIFTYYLTLEKYRSFFKRKKNESKLLKSEEWK